MKKYFLIAIALIIGVTTVNAQSNKNDEIVRTAPATVVREDAQNNRRIEGAKQVSQKEVRLKQIEKGERQNLKPEVTFYISNMEGEHCKKIITENIGFEKGVKDLKFDLENKLVTIVYDAEKTTPETLKTALEKLKYNVQDANMCPMKRTTCPAARSCGHQH